MGKCTTCGSTVLVGGINVQDARYCNKLCWAKDFSSRFQAALDDATAEKPGPLLVPDSSLETPAAVSSDLGAEPLGQDAVEWAVIGLGLVGVVAAAFLTWFLCEKLRLPFFALKARSMFPFGAIICGFVAGLGFWLALRVLHLPPTIRTWLAAGLAGLGGYLLIFALTWWFLKAGGVKVRDSLGFAEFLRLVVENPKFPVFRPGAPVGQGPRGYVQLAINMVGFTFGILVLFLIGSDRSPCSRCRRYLIRVGKQTRRSSDPENAAAALYPVMAAMSEGRIQEAIDLHTTMDPADRMGVLTTSIAVTACPGCHIHEATLVGFYPDDHGVAVAEGFVFQGKTDRRITISGCAEVGGGARPRNGQNCTLSLDVETEPALTTGFPASRAE